VSLQSYTFVNACKKCKEENRTKIVRSSNCYSKMTCTAMVERRLGLIPEMLLIISLKWDCFIQSSIKSFSGIAKEQIFTIYSSNCMQNRVNFLTYLFTYVFIYLFIYLQYLQYSTCCSIKAVQYENLCVLLREKHSWCHI
jgi:hypothetical protein